MYQIAIASDPNFQIVLPKDISSGIPCSDYGLGCLGAFEVKHRELSMIFVEFDTHENAVKVGQAINSYIIKNWVLDDVTGEPILEEFVKDAFKAVPAKSISRN